MRQYMIEHNGSTTGYFYSDDVGRMSGAQPNHNLFLTRFVAAVIQLIKGITSKA